MSIGGPRLVTPVTMASRSFLHNPKAGARPVAVLGRTRVQPGDQYSTPCPR